MKKNNIVEEFRKKMDNEPWYKKFRRTMSVRLGMWYCRILHMVSKSPEFGKGANHAVECIKDDIEFGYDREMIYNKILAGAYYNDKYNEKWNYYKDMEEKWNGMLEAIILIRETLGVYQENYTSYEGGIMIPEDLNKNWENIEKYLNILQEREGFSIGLKEYQERQKL